MKKLPYILFFSLALTLLIGAYGEGAHKDIASSLVRLHIVAESDSEKDQETKLYVRDKILEKYSFLQNCENAYQYTEAHTDEIECYANDVLRDIGAPYGAKAECGNFYFPTKDYGEFTLPAGKYDAVRITLGSGGGKNWWCVMYPPLCFTSETKCEQKNKNLLRSSMSEEDYKLITNKDKPDIKLKFKIVEYIGKLIH